MENYNEIELLSPAGDLETLKCAIENGADAIYIGGKSFSARKNAKNFSDDEIIDAVKYAHLRGVKVYVTLNTLVSDDELHDAFEFIKFCYLANVDALIVQDLAIVDICNRYFPDFEIHSSTQMTVASVSGAKMMEKLGFSRVVLAREMNALQIEEVTKTTTLETEVFVHGALCVCYSGQCLFSSVIGSRSGNRGDCAQPCRLPYEVYDYNNKKVLREPKYILSLKDYNLIDKLDELRKIGVKSLKIEGRMKNKEYVSVVSSVYNKKLLGDYLSKFDYFKLENIFSRSGFTTAYFDDKIGIKMINFEKNNDDIYKNVTDDVLNDAKQLSVAKKRFNEVYFNVIIDEKMYCFVKCGKIEFEIYPEITVQKAKTSPITEERIKEQFKKLGDTAFVCNKIDASVNGEYFVSVSDLNNARRECILKLEEKILKSERNFVNKKFSFETNAIVKNQKKHINAEVTTFEQAKHILNKEFDNVFIPYEVFIKNKEYFKKFDNVVCVLPQVDNLNTYDICDVERISVSNIGQLLGNEEKIVFSQPSLNAFNTLAVKKYNELGVNSVTLSYELNLKQISKIISDNVEIVIYGKIPLMNTKSCLHKSFLGGCKCKEDKFFSIKDRKGKVFNVKTHPLNCTNTIYNADPIYMADKLDDLEKLNVSAFRFLFTTETLKEIDNIIDLYKMRKKATFDYTRGHYYRGV